MRKRLGADGRAEGNAMNAALPKTAAIEAGAGKFKYGPHPIAEIFPMLHPGSVAFKALLEDIGQNGLREPITLYEDKILDGRNRYLALTILGQHTEERHFGKYDGSDPIGFVLSVNLHRRHLNESQRAFVGAKMANFEVGDNQHIEGCSIEQASKLVKVGISSIVRAKKVLASGDPNLIAQVQQGEITVSAAAEQAQGKKRKKKEGTTKKTPRDRFEDAWDALGLPDQEAFVETKYQELAKLMKDGGLAPCAEQRPARDGGAAARCAARSDGA
jgi:hypothetical protein